MESIPKLLFYYIPHSPFIKYANKKNNKTIKMKWQNMEINLMQCHDMYIFSMPDERKWQNKQSK